MATALRRFFNRPIRYRPAIFFFRHQFCVTLYHDKELSFDGLEAEMQKNIGAEVNSVKLQAIRCRKNSKIEISISCYPEDESFSFSPRGPFLFVIRDTIAQGHADYQLFILSGGQNEREIDIEAIIKKDGVQIEGPSSVFSYRWKPEMIESADKFSTMSKTVDSKKECTIPRESLTQEIGRGGGTIKVGECFISFQPGAFVEVTLVTITAEIDSQRWPSDREVITPSLFVDAKDMRKEASVKLRTWCVSDGNEDHVVEILHFNDKDKCWDPFPIYTCKLGDSGFVEFKCQKFSGITAVLRRFLNLPVRYQPAIYFSHRQFYVALYRDTKLDSDKMEAKMEKSRGKNLNVELFQIIPCKRDSKIELSISCSPVEKIFCFKPPGPFPFSIHDVAAKNGISYYSCTFTGGRYEKELDIEVILKKNEKQVEGPPPVFSYRWKPEYLAASRDVSCSHKDALDEEKTPTTSRQESAIETDQLPTVHCSPNITVTVKNNVDESSNVANTLIKDKGEMTTTNTGCSSTLHTISPSQGHSNQ